MSLKCWGPLRTPTTEVRGPWDTLPSTEPRAVLVAEGGLSAGHTGHTHARTPTLTHRYLLDAKSVIHRSAHLTRSDAHSPTQVTRARSLEHTLAFGDLRHQSGHTATRHTQVGPPRYTDRHTRRGPRPHTPPPAHTPPPTVAGCELEVQVLRPPPDTAFLPPLPVA